MSLYLGNTKINSLQAEYAPRGLQTTKVVTPTETVQLVSPDAGYDGLTSVVVEGIPDNYIDKENTGNASPSDVIKGKIFTSATAGIAIEGTYEIPTITDLLPNRNNPANTQQILSGYQGINQNGEVIIGTHECPTITDLLPVRSNPAGSEQILSGYQGIDSNGAIVNGIAEAGGGYEIVETAATSLKSGAEMTVYHTLGNISGFYSSPLDIGGYIGDGSSSLYNAIGVSMLNTTNAKCLYISGTGSYQLSTDMIKNSYGNGSITFTSKYNCRIVKSTFIFVA